MNFDILNILFEDPNFLVVFKPAGILVHPDKYSQEKTLIDLVVERYPEIKAVGGPTASGRPGIVHRLDKEVSGLLVIARTEAAYQSLCQQFKDGLVKKEYLALVHGQPASTHNIIDLPLARNEKGKIIAVQYRKDVKNEKPAQTEYWVEKKYENSSLLRVRILTGRTHQIRVHLRAINCPIVGDEQYGFKDKTFGNDLGRIFLHSSYLGFNDLNNKWVEFKSDLPEELINFLSKIK
ncbi:MAG: RluA family pseudouridine synthase [Patescibacteria group bacterium]|nr:RluA family pseudouridine synthase [Patescibacteria group bacterium]MDD5121226.1 RluA family pseudouridine synthase [Patescibacteria group bacterium]MDD5221745.1 RluA family pseudouridine synthase [Patescibacteria group bacterium]MDD5395855.1 RluA family pseudouridine synthase [Patescibacteria group bacterium]